MSDTAETTRVLKFVATFADGDTRTITVNRPPQNTSNIGSKIAQLETLAANVLIGDKYGAAFTAFQDAKVVQQTRTYLDLGE